MSIQAINVRNQFRGKVREIVEGPVVSEIDVETPQGLVVTSVIIRSGCTSGQMSRMPGPVSPV